MSSITSITDLLNGQRRRHIGRARGPFNSSPFGEVAGKLITQELKRGSLIREIPLRSSSKGQDFLLTWT
jgi:hypothetical protein